MLFFGVLVLHLNNCVIMLIKVFWLKISDSFLCAFLGNSIKFLDRAQFSCWMLWTCLCVRRGGVSPAGPRRSLRPLVQRRPAGLRGELGSDCDASSDVGGVPWWVFKLLGRMAVRSDCPVRTPTLLHVTHSLSCLNHSERVLPNVWVLDVLFEIKHYKWRRF